MFHTKRSIVFAPFRILVLASFVCYISKGYADTLDDLPDHSHVLLEQCMAAFPNLYQSVTLSNKQIAEHHLTNLNNNELSEESHYLEPVKLNKGDVIEESHYLEPVPEENYYGVIFDDDEKPQATVVNLHPADVSGKTRRRNPAHKLKKSLKKLWFKHKGSKDANNDIEKFYPKPLPPLPLESEPIYEEIQ